MREDDIGGMPSGWHDASDIGIVIYTGSIVLRFGECLYVVPMSMLATLGDGADAVLYERKYMKRKWVTDFFRKCIFYLKDWRFRRSYSQYGEDLMLIGFLRDKWSWSYKGFYVDIGAHHPRILSNTKKFYDIGWHGINVEPSVDAINLFRKARHRDINVNVGIGIECGEFDYYRLSCKLMNTFSKQFAESAIAEGGVSLVDILKVPVMTMEQLLDKYLPAGQNIDFVSIDCEGLDLEILKSNNWEKYRPEFILIEVHTNNKNLEIPHGDVAVFLRSVGYEHAGQSFVTSLFQRVSDRIG